MSRASPAVDRVSSPSNIAAMPSTSRGYRAALRVGAAIAPALGIFSPRLRLSAMSRLNAGERLLDWARSDRDDARPLVWFHAASVGEGLQAESVLRQLRRLSPECQVVYTHFSPSAQDFAHRLDVDVADYLPYDLPENAERLLSSLKPDLLVFAKLDLWPELSTRTSFSGARVAMVAATVSPGSGRLRWPARALLRPGYQAVDAAAAISPADATRLALLGVAPERIRVLGDPRFDSVIEKVRSMGSRDPLLRWGEGAPTMVAGSTWPPDESVLLTAFAGIRRIHPEARLILVPHEPTRGHLQTIDRDAARAGLPRPVRLSEAQAAAPLLLVDRVGILAALYGAGSMAYVGGGFGGAGLHSVLEPAAWAVPVAFGPRSDNSRDAALLLGAGGGIALPRPGAAAALEEQWGNWIRDDAGRAAQGMRGREMVEQGAGASQRSAEMLLELISSRSPRTSPIEARSIRPSVP
jgi:3-deoxy-D-manno-octulosonic-acid transferase